MNGYAPDEIGIRWATFQMALKHRKPARTFHSKWIVEYKRKTRRLGNWHQAYRASVERFVQGGVSVA
jgi:hypothetical protein